MQAIMKIYYSNARTTWSSTSRNSLWQDWEIRYQYIAIYQKVNSQDKLPDFVPYHDYNEEIWDSVHKKYISLKPKNTIALENNGFSNSYAELLSPKKSESSTKKVSKYRRATPVTAQLGSIESADYETRKAVLDYLQSQNAPVDVVPNHIELSADMLSVFENLCHLYDTKPQVFEYSYDALCVVKTFLVKNKIPTVFSKDKEYAPFDNPLLYDLCKIFETNPDLADKSFEELLKKKGLFSKKTKQLYLSDELPDEDSEEQNEE